MKNLLFVLFFLTLAVACTHRSSSSDMREDEVRKIMEDVSKRNRNYEPLTERDDTMMQRVVP